MASGELENRLPMETAGTTHQERERWREDGFFVREAVFRGPELEVLREAAERVVSRAEAATTREGESYRIDGNRYHEAGGATIQYEHRPESRAIRVIEPFHHLDARLDAMLDDLRIVAPMRDLVGSDRVAIFTDKVNLKRPREGSGFRWHQDSPYWTHFCSHVDRLPNVMLALDDASERNGCFRVVRGSHTRGCLPGLEGDGVLGPLFTDPRSFDAREVMSGCMPPPRALLCKLIWLTCIGNLPLRNAERVGLQ